MIRTIRSFRWHREMLVACVLFYTSRAWPLPLAPTNAIQPTITSTMGDLGGKFFERTPDAAKTRHYYISAEPQLWDYAPQGRDVACTRHPAVGLAKARDFGSRSHSAFAGRGSNADSGVSLTLALPFACGRDIFRAAGKQNFDLVQSVREWR